MKDEELKHTETTFGLTSIRQFRETVFHAALELRRAHDGKKLLLALHEPGITTARLKREYARMRSVFQADVLDRIVIAAYRNGRAELIGGSDHHLADRARVTQPAASDTIKVPEGGAPYRLLKVFLLHALTRDTPVTTKWLSETAGCNYRIAAAFLQGLGSLVERTRDRRIRLKWVAQDEIMRLHYLARQYRPTYRFADQSRRGADFFHYIDRLGKLDLPKVALGGVVGAQHYLPRLDIINTPRLDLSLHCPGKTVSLAFVKRLDPALELIESPDAPADVIVHLVRHPSSLFTPRAEGLSWADPLECLLDLYEARLGAQASQFFAYLHGSARHGQS
jgi:hypothetical protein